MHLKFYVIFISDMFSAFTQAIANTFDNTFPLIDWTFYEHFVINWVPLFKSNDWQRQSFDLVWHFLTSIMYLSVLEDLLLQADKIFCVLFAQLCPQNFLSSVWPSCNLWLMFSDSSLLCRCTDGAQHFEDIKVCNNGHPVSIHTCLYWIHAARLCWYVYHCIQYIPPIHTTIHTTIHANTKWKYWHVLSCNTCQYLHVAITEVSPSLFILHTK